MILVKLFSNKLYYKYIIKVWILNGPFPEMSHIDILIYVDYLSFFIIQFNRLSNLPDCQMVWLIGFVNKSALGPLDVH